MKKGEKSCNRRRPHILPPLPAAKRCLEPSPMEPLQPPSVFIGMDGRLGSPKPRWHRPHFDDAELEPNSTEGKPGIRITHCIDADSASSKGGLRKDLMKKESRKERQFPSSGGFLNKTTGAPSPATKPKGSLPNRFTPLKPINWQSNEN